MTTGTDAGSEDEWYYVGTHFRVPGFMWHSLQQNNGAASNYLRISNMYGWKGLAVGSSDHANLIICQLVDFIMQ